MVNSPSSPEIFKLCWKQKAKCVTVSNGVFTVCSYNI